MRHLVLLVFASSLACGTPHSATRADDVREPAQQTEPEPTRNAAPGPSDTADAEKIREMCEWYASSKVDDGLPDESHDEGQLTRECMKDLAEYSAADRALIEQCAGACGASEGIVDCFEQFGSPMFPACSADDHDDDDDTDD